MPGKRDKTSTILSWNFHAPEPRSLHCKQLWKKRGGHTIVYVGCMSGYCHVLLPSKFLKSNSTVHALDLNAKLSLHTLNMQLSVNLVAPNSLHGRGVGQVWAWSRPGGPRPEGAQFQHKGNSLHDVSEKSPGQLAQARAEGFTSEYQAWEAALPSAIRGVVIYIYIVSRACAVRRNRTRSE